MQRHFSVLFFDMGPMDIFQFFFFDMRHMNTIFQFFFLTWVIWVIRTRSDYIIRIAPVHKTETNLHIIVVFIIVFQSLYMYV